MAERHVTARECEDHRAAFVKVCEQKHETEDQKIKVEATKIYGMNWKINFLLVLVAVEITGMLYVIFGPKEKPSAPVQVPRAENLQDPAARTSQR